MKEKFCRFVIGVSFYSFAVEFLRIKVAGLTVPITLVLLLMLALIVARSRRIDKQLAVFLVINVGFVSVIILSSIVNGSASAPLVILKYIICLGSAFVVYMVALSRKEKVVQDLESVVMWSSLPVALHSFYSYIVLGSPYLTGSLVMITEVGKNQVAAFVTVMAVLNLALAFRTNNKITRLMLLCSLLVYYIAILYSYSRSALVSCVLASLLIFLLAKTKRNNKIAMLAGFIMLSAMLMPLAWNAMTYEMRESFRKNMDSLVSMQDQGESTSISVRSEMISVAYSRFSDAPVIGSGPNSFVEATSIASHNTYMQVLAEFGLAGMLFYLLAILYALSRTFKSDPALAMVLLCLMMTLFFQNAMESVFVFVIIGSLLACSRKIDVSNKRISEIYET